MDIEGIFQRARARSADGLKWGTQLVLALEAKRVGLGVEWAIAVFGHFIQLACFDVEPEARRLYREHIEQGAKLTSGDELREHWILHERNTLEIAVLRLWTALSWPSNPNDAGTALELMFEDPRLDVIAREAPLLLFRDYIRR